MRKLLKQQEGRRGEFRATVAQFGTKSAFRGPDLSTMMLKDVKDETGQIVTDHLWMTVGKQLSRLNVQVGEEIVFVARVTRYEKGYKGFREDVFAAPPSTDYRLSYPTKVRRGETRPPARERCHSAPSTRRCAQPNRMPTKAPLCPCPPVALNSR